METRSRDRSRIKDKKQEEEETTFNLVIKANLKTVLEHFIESEIKKKFGKKEYQSSLKKQKNEFVFNMIYKDKSIFDSVVETVISSEGLENGDIRAYIGEQELIYKPKKESKEIDTNLNVLNTVPKENIREISIKNIPGKLTNEKLYEIFFIFGDISKIEYVREERRAYMKFKYCSSAQKAIRKLSSDKSKNLVVQFSDPSTRNDITGDERDTEEKQDKQIGRVIFIKFSDSNIVPEKEEVKKHLTKFGLVSKMFRKKEGRSFYIEFTSESSSEDFLRAYNSGMISLKGVLQIDYAFNKWQSDQEININKVEETTLRNESSAIVVDKYIPSETVIDPNKNWQVYYDANYQTNFYFNPFFNQSVWTLPEGAELSPYQNTESLYLTEKKESQVEVSAEEEVREQNHYDDDAWEEDELTEKLAWDRIREQQVKEWMKRPARQQVTDTRRDTAYIEGNYDYNIWYDKYLTDRKEEKEKIPALHKCSPLLDTGYTKADIQEKEGGAYFCLFFAKGCCSEGVNCRYYHRLPTLEDAEKIENLRDVFGRSRFAAHRNDMGGVGSFTKECRSIFVTDLKMIEAANPIKEMVRLVYDNFSPWGEIEDINYIPAKATCFIRFSHRCFAEFAKEAMIGQSMVGEEILTVKWAYDDPNPMNKKLKERENENRFLGSYNRRQENITKIKERMNYGSGYGQDEHRTQQIGDQRSQTYTNSTKLSETLKMIDEMNQENNY